MELSGVLSRPWAAVLRALPAPVSDLLPGRRRVEPWAGGVRIELRGAGRAGGTGDGGRARELEDRLCAMDGVERAEVNGVLGRVYVVCDVAATDVDKLVAITEELDEEAAPGPGEPFPATAAPKPGDPLAAAVALGANLAGGVVALAGRATGLTGLPALVPAVVGLAENTPKVRAELERRLGRTLTDAAFGTARVVTQTLAMRPLGLLTDAVAAGSRFVERRAATRSLRDREADLAHRPGACRQARVRRPARPVPLPAGPVERYADVAGPAALAAYGVTAVISRDHERALGPLVALLPRAAHLGRDAYVSALGRALAGRGVTVLDREALARMDRIDTVVIDLAALRDADGSPGRDNPAPPDLGGSPSPAGPGGAAGPTWAGDAVHSLAEAVVAAAGGSCAVLLAGVGAATAERLKADGVLPGGARLASHVRRLQADGHGVAVVSRRAASALAQADLGIGVPGRRGRTPWEADVLAGPEGVHLMLACLGPARQASRLAVRLAAAGAAAGGALSLLGPAASATRHAQLAGELTALGALAAGEWAGRGAGRVPAPRPVDRTPWHAMPVQEVLARLGSSVHGLSPAEAARRTASSADDGHGRPDSLVSATAEELANPLTPVMAAGAGLSTAVGSVLDAGLIMVVLVANALMGAGQRVAADRALRQLTDAVAIGVRLRRDGATRDGQPAGATSDDLVVGDVIELRAGDVVPADCRLLKAGGLEVDEASLTGESQLAGKHPAPVGSPYVAERACMVYQGTTVAAGHGLAVVVATGAATEANRSSELTTGQPPPTGVELRLRELAGRMLPLSIGSGALLFAVNLLRRTGLAGALAPAVALAVAALPEGLPFVATVAELAAAKRLSARNTLVRNPSTIEALGRVDVLCFDKTGTLTEGRISLRRISDGLAAGPAGDGGDSRDSGRVDVLPDRLRAVLAAALRAGPRTDGGRAVPHPTDRAVLEGARRLAITPQYGLDGWRHVGELPFEPGRGYHAVLGAAPSGRVLSVKGAPEVMLERCECLLRDGAEIPLDAALRRELEEHVDALAKRGMRVLAVAERTATDRDDMDDGRVERLRLLGFLGLADPVRPTAARSVRRLAEAGIRVVMVTGDHPSTAAAIAAELDLLGGMRVMTGPELDALDDDALAAVLPEVAVFARVTPAHKARIVACLHRAGRVVAVTGDGANDAPAIRLSDVGVALGRAATPAARAVADVVVTDDRIETIIDAIVEGRVMWASVKDALGILLGGNLGEIAFTVGSTLLTGSSALNTRQLLLVNLLTDLLPAMVVAVRPPGAANPGRLLAEGPEASLGATLTRDIYARGVITALAAGLAWTLARLTGTRARADTVGLIGLVSAQLLQTLAAGPKDRAIAAASLGSLAALALAVSVPGVSTMFGCRPVGPAGWLIGLGSAAAVQVGAILRAELIGHSSVVH